MRDELGVALVGVQMSPVPDQVYLKALLIEIEKLLRQLTGKDRKPLCCDLEGYCPLDSFRKFMFTYVIWVSNTNAKGPVLEVAGDISLAAIDTTPTAIRQALIRCDKAYRGSAADLLYI
jgi:hypothetical protein